MKSAANGSHDTLLQTVPIRRRHRAVQPTGIGPQFIAPDTQDFAHLAADKGEPEQITLAAHFKHRHRHRIGERPQPFLGHADAGQGFLALGHIQPIAVPHPGAVEGFRHHGAGLDPTRRGIAQHHPIEQIGRLAPVDGLGLGDTGGFQIVGMQVFQAQPRIIHQLGRGHPQDARNLGTDETEGGERPGTTSKRKVAQGSESAISRSN